MLPFAPFLAVTLAGAPPAMGAGADPGPAVEKLGSSSSDWRSEIDRARIVCGEPAVDLVPTPPPSSTVPLAAITRWESSAPGPAPEGVPLPVIAELTISGNERTTAASLLDLLSQRVGEPIIATGVTADLHALFHSGLFEDVSAAVEPIDAGVRLTYSVRERRRVGRFYLTGATLLTPTRVRDELGLAAGAPFDPRMAMAGAQRLLTELRDFGHIDARLTFHVLRANGRDDLCVQIDDGQEYHERLRFVGNRAKMDAELTRCLPQDVLETQRLDSWDPTAYLLSCYYEDGYIRASVSGPDTRIDRDKHVLELVMTITEGSQYRLGKLDVSGDLAVDVARYRARLRSREGDIFSRGALFRDVERIEQLHKELGRQDLVVSVQSEIDEERRAVNINLAIAGRQP